MEDQPAVEVPANLVRFDNPVFMGLEPSEEAAVPAAKASDLNHSQLDEMINAMLPAREWSDASGTWMQSTSKEPATRLDVISLQEQLDRRLQERQARENGICPVREDLYSQCFDELIRQITLDGPERGLLLMRVKDEIRMTIDAYKTLYEGSVTFGVKKQLQAEQGIPEMEKRIDGLKDECRTLENTVAELRNRVEVMEKRAGEQRALEEQKRKEEKDFLQYQGQNLDAFLKQLGGK
mmetsp:Transcript_36382/g.114055  ORF Transcript_36382/g.114055 Transcript_36382/m.114055 type:complete len:237 (-) Transcript_36382:231-941(-)|eukprot:CAMPEP_0118866376 /NCGR_PEP_ID=MMETSP1163-20130328/10313_1 /TAXON_ID=124430 /ORGANISM="Phaeomonas parva, Strain CCMP2877" /LENGTH=236 /DNA_ID=CAMNT_0006800685 /DNA_START=60 /DNA_END=770 /DNA_ORIENTATION=-